MQKIQPLKIIKALKHMYTAARAGNYEPARQAAKLVKLDAYIMSARAQAPILRCLVVVAETAASLAGHVRSIARGHENAWTSRARAFKLKIRKTELVAEVAKSTGSARVNIDQDPKTGALEVRCVPHEIAHLSPAEQEQRLADVRVRIAQAAPINEK